MQFVPRNPLALQRCDAHGVPLLVQHYTWDVTRHTWWVWLFTGQAHIVPQWVAPITGEEMYRNAQDVYQALCAYVEDDYKRISKEPPPHA